MISSATSYSSISTCKGYYYTSRLLQGALKKALQLTSIAYGLYQVPQAFSRGGGQEAVKSLITYMGLVPFAIEGFSPVLQGEYLSNCAPETMARIEGKSVRDITARANAFGEL